MPNVTTDLDQPPSHLTILVTGATGTQGGATARRLADRGWHVRAVVRDPSAAAARALDRIGVDIVSGDLDRPETLPAAMKDVHGLFLVPPASFGPQGWNQEEELRRGRAAIDAAATAGVRHIVFTGMASIGTDAEWGATAKQQIERHLVNSGVPWTVLRPARFMENYLARDLPLDGLVGGVHRHLFVPDAPLQMIAADDIGIFAEMAFARPQQLTGIALEIAGDDPTPEQAVEQISRATGRTYRYERITEEEAKAFGHEIHATWRMHAAGVSWRADLASLRTLHPELMRLTEWLSRGGAARIAGTSDQDTAAG